MGKKPFGKDFSSMTKEEIAKIMAEWRSRRNGNGRKGYRMPDAQRIHTDNFKDPNKEWHPGMPLKSVNEHVKCIFICVRDIYPKDQAYGQMKTYYIGFLSDSNRYSFEEFRDLPSSLVKDKEHSAKYRILKYKSMFAHKNIDKDTEITVCVDGMNMNSDLMPIMLKFMVSFTCSKISRIKYPKIIRKFIKEYRLFGKQGETISKNCEKYKDISRIHKIFDMIYDFVAENKICPWITVEHRDEILTYTRYKRYSRMIVELGLLYTLIVKFNYLQNRKLKEEKADKSI